tara:strand:+ start:5949 stop:6335 length:387 start_codon:yes stop_codon:yes gene_type:complete
MPHWIKDGYQHYAQKLKLKHQLIELKDPDEAKVSKYLDSNALHIALDSRGHMLTSEAVASKINFWKIHSINVNFYIGGFQGLSADHLSRCNEKWSLSLQTYPHQLVKIMLIEQIFRAESILLNHPYHK